MKFFSERRVHVATSLLSVACVLLALYVCFAPPPGPSLSDRGPSAPRARASIDRLKNRLRHPGSLRVLSVVNPPTHPASVEIHFEAEGESGVGRSRFWVRWTDSGPVDGFPESPGGARDDPNGLFRD